MITFLLFAPWVLTREFPSILLSLVPSLTDMSLSAQKGTHLIYIRKVGFVSFKKQGGGIRLAFTSYRSCYQHLPVAKLLGVFTS